MIRMDSTNKPNSDVLQSHDHEKLTAEQIAKAVERHNRAHKGSADKGTDTGKKKQGKK
jgi:hypothetical protein